jgi:hypothetical protein
MAPAAGGDLNRLRDALPDTVIQFRTTEALLDSAGRALRTSADPEVAGRLVRQASDALASLGVALLRELGPSGADTGPMSWMTVLAAPSQREAPQRRDPAADDAPRLDSAPAE